MERPFRVLLVNNASEAAFAATTRRFGALLARAGAPETLDLRVATLPGPERGAWAGLAARRLLDIGPDGLPDIVVVTGAEPACVRLRDEPCWPALVGLFEAAAQRGVPLLLSCMASHAAVLHATGIERQRLPRKMSGLYREEAAALGHLPSAIAMPHSRWNTLPEAALAAPSLRVLTRSREGGAGAFLINGPVPWLCLQGHPEYGAATLAGEHRRDLARFRAGQLADPPDPPTDRSGLAADATVWQAHGAGIVAGWLDDARRARLLAA